MDTALAQAVTFGASGLDRAGHLRATALSPDGLISNDNASVLPVWKGKPLLANSDCSALLWLRPDHAGLSDANEPAMFLGLDNGHARFALDLSHWEPTQPPDGPIDVFLDTSEQVHPDFPKGSRFAELRGCMTGLSARDAELAATARALILWHSRHRFCSNCGATTEVVLAGWQRDCAACSGSHYPRTDPVVIMLITRGNSVLVGRSPVWPDGMYSLLAGFVEPGETVEAAVRREVLEESSIEVGPVRYLVSQPWPFPASLMLACQGEATSEAITVDPVELEDARWVPREEMLEVFAGTHPEIRSPRRGAIARFVLERWLADRLDEPMA